VRFNIDHRTTYRYRQEVTLHRIDCCYSPEEAMSLWSTAVLRSPTTDLSWTEDVFGNIIATATFAEPTDVLEIVSTIAVEQMAVPWPIFAIGVDAQFFPFSYLDETLGDLGQFRTPLYEDPAGEIRDWAMGSWSENPQAPLRCSRT